MKEVEASHRGCGGNREAARAVLTGCVLLRGFCGACTVCLFIIGCHREIRHGRSEGDGELHILKTERDSRQASNSQREDGNQQEWKIALEFQVLCLVGTSVAF